MPRDGLRGVIWWWMGGILRGKFFGNKSYINLSLIFASPYLRLRRSVMWNKFFAACPYRTAAFWKEATMAEDLHLLGVGDRKVKNPPTLKSSGYSETWLRAGDAEA